MSREILALKRREDGIFEIYADGKLVEEYEASEDTWGALLPIKLWRHFNNIVEKRIKQEDKMETIKRDTQFIEQFDKILRDYYGEDFKWDTIFISHFNKNNVGYVAINTDFSKDNMRSPEVGKIEEKVKSILTKHIEPLKWVDENTREICYLIEHGDEPENLYILPKKSAK